MNHYKLNPQIAQMGADFWIQSFKREVDSLNENEFICDNPCHLWTIQYPQITPMAADYKEIINSGFAKNPTP